jgi:HSP20 family protein
MDTYLDNIIVRVLPSSLTDWRSTRHVGDHPTAAGGTEPPVDLQEVRQMTLVRRTSPFSELVTLRRAMDHLFDDSVFRPFSAYADSGDIARLPLDVRTTPDALLVEAALPGLSPEDVDITVENNTLTIRAQDSAGHTVEESGWLVREISRGSVMRTLTLPTGLEAERAEATFEHGMLRLRIPRAEQVKPRQIQIRTVTPGEGKAVEAGPLPPDAPEA